MYLTINHNLMAVNAARNLSSHYGAMGTSVQRLSSGLRINSADDDAAGLAVRELMRSDVRTLNQGVKNANDAVSMIQTADGALEIIDEKLIRMRELAEQASTGTYTSDQRIIINNEFKQMSSEIQRIASSTEFNGIKLLDGHFDKTTIDMKQINIKGFGQGQSNLISREVVEVHGELYSGDWLGNIWKYENGTDWSLIGTGQGPSYVYEHNGELITKNDSGTGVIVRQLVNGSLVQINNDGFGNPNNFGNDGAATVNGTFYFSTHNSATGTEVHKYNGNSNWEQISTSGFGDPANEDCYLAEYNNTLVASTWNTNGSQIYQYTEGSWKKISEDGWGDRYLKINLTTVNGKLYGVGGKSTGAKVYRYDGGTTWTPISEPGFGDTKNTSGFITTFNNEIYVGTSVGGASTGGEIYKYNGNNDWTSIVKNGLGDKDNKQCILSSAGNTLYVTTYNGNDGCKVYTLARQEDDPIEVHFGTSNRDNIDNYGIPLSDAGITSRGLDIIDYDISTQTGAQYALEGLTTSIMKKDRIRSDLGAMQNRLENTITNISTQSENLQYSESRISDTDISEEFTNFIKEQILTQAATALLAQANSMPKTILKIITGE